jgi:hypothetical protein
VSRHRRNVYERKRAREVMRTLSEPMKRRVRAQRQYGRDQSPDLWGYYPRLGADFRGDSEVAFRTFVDLHAYGLKKAIINSDWREAKREIVRLFEQVSEQEKARWPSNVIDLASYRRARVETGGPAS